MIKNNEHEMNMKQTKIVADWKMNLNYLKL